MMGIQHITDLEHEDLLFQEHMQRMRARLGGALGGLAVAAVFVLLASWRLA